jgi:hypothetical protein
VLRDACCLSQLSQPSVVHRVWTMWPERNTASPTPISPPSYNLVYCPVSQLLYLVYDDNSQATSVFELLNEECAFMFSSSIWFSISCLHFPFSESRKRNYQTTQTLITTYSLIFPLRTFKKRTKGCLIWPRRREITVKMGFLFDQLMSYMQLCFSCVTQR